MYSRRLVFGAACLGMLLFGIVLISLGSVLPSLTAKFALDDIAAGSLAALLPFGILIGSLVFGPIADRYGYKSLLVPCAFLVFLSLEGIAFARSLTALQISILLIGFGGGILNGATNALVADISTEGRGAGLSLLGVFFGIGALGMPAILGLLSSRFTQEGIIAGIGAVVLVCAGSFAAVQFPAPKQARGFPLAQGLKLLRDARLMLFAAVLFFQSGMEGSVNNWTTTFLQQGIGATPENALFALSSFVAGLAVARLLLSRLLKRFPAWKVLAVSIAFSAAGCLMLWIAGGYVSALSGLVLLGIGFAGVFPVMLGIVGDLYASFSGTAFSIVFVVALIGNMASNYLVGVVGQLYGIRFLPVLVVLCLCIMSLLMRVAFKRVGRSHAC